MLLPTEWILARIPELQAPKPDPRLRMFGPVAPLFEGRFLGWRWDRSEGFRCLWLGETGAAVVTEPLWLPDHTECITLHPVSASTGEVPEFTFGRQLIAALPVANPTATEGTWCLYVIHDVLRMEVLFTFALETDNTRHSVTRVHLTESQFGENS